MENTDIEMVKEQLPGNPRQLLLNSLFSLRRIIGYRHRLIWYLNAILTKFPDQGDPDIAAGFEAVVQVVCPDDRL